MKRNGRNLKMPKVEGMTSDRWSTMTNTERYSYLKALKKKSEIKPVSNDSEVEVIE